MWSKLLNKKNSLVALSVGARIILKHLLLKFVLCADNSTGSLRLPVAFFFVKDSNKYLGALAAKTIILWRSLLYGLLQKELVLHEPNEDQFGQASFQWVYPSPPLLLVLLSSSHSLTDAATTTTTAAHNKWQPTYNLHYTLALPFYSTCGNRNQNLGITLLLSSSPCSALHFSLLCFDMFLS